MGSRWWSVVAEKVFHERMVLMGRLERCVLFTYRWTKTDAFWLLLGYSRCLPALGMCILNSSGQQMGKDIGGELCLANS